MDDLLTRQNVSVETDADRVILTVQKMTFMIPYAQGFKIAAGIASGGRECLRLSNEPRADWRKWLELDDSSIRVNEVPPGKSAGSVRKFDWRVDVRGEMIHLWLGDVRVGFHFESGFKLSQWLRLGSAQAKRWAGDTSKSLTASGRLTNREENYKLGLE
jgi:hypothetical protein